LSADPDLSLEELLRKCHRDELVALALAVHVRPQGLGLADLASAVARTLRRRGANDLANLLFRRGAGPDYADVLDGVLMRSQIPREGSIEQREHALVQAALVDRWTGLDDEARGRLWKTMGMSPPIPDDGETAAGAVGEQQRERSRYTMASAVVATQLVPVLPLGGCVALYWAAKPDDKKLIPAVIEVARLRQAVRRRVTVGVVGSPSSGKDAAVRALFGLDSGNVDPVAGSTKEVEITRLPHATALFVVNTPGLGDVMESVTEEARQVLEHIDVYLYIVNAQGGVQARELADYQSAVASGRPVLALVNKIDTLRERDREPYLADARAKLGAPEHSFAAVAFDPLPQLSELPIGLQPVQAWLEARLAELGKDPSELPWR
jgi:hypothetical protein